MEKSTILGLALVGGAGYLALKGKGDATTFSGGGGSGGGFLMLPTGLGEPTAPASKKDFPDINIYETSDLAPAPATTTKKSTSVSPYTPMKSDSPVGTTYPVTQGGKVTGYEVMTPEGGVSTKTPEAYGGTIPITKKETAPKPKTSFWSAFGKAITKGSVWRKFF